MLHLPSLEGGGVERLAFTADGHWLVSIASHPRDQARSAPVRLWNRHDGSQPYVPIPPRHYGRCMAMSADGRLSAWTAITTRGPEICVWDVSTMSQRTRLPIRQANVAAAAFDAAGDRLALLKILDGERTFPRCVDVCGTTYGRVLKQIMVGEVSVPTSIVLSADGDFLIVGHSTGVVRFYNVNESKPLRKPRFVAAESVVQLQATTDMKKVVAFTTQHATVFDVPEHKKRDPLPLQDRFSAGAIDPAGRMLAVAGADGAIAFWDMTDSRQTRVYDWNIGPIGAVAFAPDGLTCAAGGPEGRIVIWDLDDG